MNKIKILGECQDNKILKEFLLNDFNIDSVCINLKSKYVHQVNSNSNKTHKVLSNENFNKGIVGKVDYYHFDIFNSILYINDFNNEKYVNLSDVLGKLIFPKTIISKELPSFLQENVTNMSNMLESIFANYVPEKWISSNEEQEFKKEFNNCQFINLKKCEIYYLSCVQQYSYL